MSKRSNKSDEQEATTGIRVIPPLIYLVGIIVGLVLEYLWKSYKLSVVFRVSVSLMLLIVSVVLIGLTLKQFKSSKTPFDVRKSASSLITDGPFQFSRNPGYIALTLLYMAFGILLSNMWVLVLVVPILLIVDIHIIRKEEANLLAVFGDHYIEYQSKVRRWF